MLMSAAPSLSPESVSGVAAPAAGTASAPVAGLAAVGPVKALALTVQSADRLATKFRLVEATAGIWPVDTLMSPTGPATVLGGVMTLPCTRSPVVVVT